MRERARLLVVDDEPAIRLFLAEELADAGYTVVTAASGEQALVILEKEEPDLVLLDLNMPGMNGLQVLDEIGKRPIPPVVIILTAYGTLESAISALRDGAADYLLKPCTADELLASVAQGLGRRDQELRQQELVRLIESSAHQLRVPGRGEPVRPTSPPPPRLLEARGLLLDREKLAVRRQGVPLALTPTEFKVLACLMERADRPLSFVEISYLLYGSAEDENTARQSLKTHLWRLERKLGMAPDGRPYIVNVRGRGYKFVP